MPEGTNTTEAAPAIYAAAIAVMGMVKAIGKDHNMPAEARVGEYAYRSNEDVQEAIAAAFRECAIATQSRDLVLTQAQTSVQGRNGSTLWTSVWVTITYQFTSLEDGSFLEFTAAGEGRDNSDKATNKAMTAAHKTALTQLFEVAYNAPDPERERPMTVQEDAYRPAPPPQADNRTDAQRKAEADYQARRSAPQDANAADPARPAQARPADPDPVGTATRNLQQGMDAQPVNGVLELEQQATRVLATAHRDYVRADMGHKIHQPTDAQRERAQNALVAIGAAKDRDHANRIVLQCQTEGLLLFTVGGDPVAASLAAARNTYPAVTG
jgi:hypothetical protein